MEKAVIVGAFEFVGFHLCKKMLDDGIEVVGVHLPTNEDKERIEEKRLEIGRNSNFTEIAVTEWNGEENDSYDCIILNVYDFFMQEKEEVFFTNVKVKQRKKVHLLLPITSLNEERFSPFTTQIEKLTERIEEEDGQFQLIYLPTIFGPWQPISFTFQQIIEKDHFVVSPRESLHHALYVDETVDELIHLFSQEEKQFVLLDDEENSWLKCLERLNKKYELEKERTPIQFPEVKKFVKRKTDLAVGLEKQKNHYQYLRQLESLNK